MRFPHIRTPVFVGAFVAVVLGALAVAFHGTQDLPDARTFPFNGGPAHPLSYEKVFAGLRSCAASVDTSAARADIGILIHGYAKVSPESAARLFGGINRTGFDNTRRVLVFVDGDARLQDVVTHEMAHAFANAFPRLRYYPDSSHVGDRWAANDHASPFFHRCVRIGTTGT